MNGVEVSEPRPGGLHLVGGGWGGDGSAWRPFLAEAGARSASPDGPLLAVIAVRDGDREEHASKLLDAVRAAGPCRARVAAVAHGERVDPEVLDGVDGVLVGGGLMPAYLAAVLPLADRIRDLVRNGVPYAGFSAGAAVASEAAILGGWRLNGVPVVAREAGGKLDALTVRPGLGLAPLTVDVHAAQWGTLARLVAAVESGLVARGAPIDEHAALVLRAEGHRVVGAGAVWWVERGETGVVVRREVAGG